MLLIKSQRATYVVAVAAALLLALCGNETKPADAQLALGGTEEISSTGIIGSMRHQANVAPVVQRNQLIKDESIANENAHTATMHHHHQQLKANMKREAPAVPDSSTSKRIDKSSSDLPGVRDSVKEHLDAATSHSDHLAAQLPKRHRRAAQATVSQAKAPEAASPAAQQQQAAPQEKAANSSSTSSKSDDKSSPAQPSLKDKLKEHLNTASQAVASYSDQLAAQIPKRLRREAVEDKPMETLQDMRARCVDLYAKPLEPPNNMTDEAHRQAMQIRIACNRHHGNRLIELMSLLEWTQAEAAHTKPAPTRFGRQAPEAATSSAAQPKQQQQQAPQEKAADSSSTSKSGDKSSPAQASLKDKLKEHLNTASQAAAGYSDQLAAQIPKRLRRATESTSTKPPLLEYFIQLIQKLIDLCAIHNLHLNHPHELTDDKTDLHAKRKRDYCSRSLEAEELVYVGKEIEDDHKQLVAQMSDVSEGRQSDGPSSNTDATNKLAQLIRDGCVNSTLKHSDASTRQSGSPDEAATNQYAAKVREDCNSLTGHELLKMARYLSEDDANEHKPVMRFTRQAQAPAAEAASPAAGSNNKSGESGSPDQASSKNKLKEHLNTASQAIAGYSDQLAAQIPKRLRRGVLAEVGGAGMSYAQQVRERCIKLYAEPLEAPHNMSEEAHQKAKRIRERCNRYTGAKLEEVKDFIDEDEKKQPPAAKPAAPTRSRRQAHPSGHSEHGANGNSYEHSYDHSYNHGQSYNNNYGGNSHGFSNTPAYNGAAGSGSSSSGGTGSQSKLAELGEKLNSARQLLQSVRERCAEGYVPTNEHNSNYNNEHRPLRRERDSQAPESSERASKLGETFAGLRNKTNEVRQLVQSVRQQCAESLGNQARPNDHHRNQQHQQQGSPLVRHRRQAPAQNQAASAINSAAAAAAAGPAALANSAQQVASGHSNGVESSLAAFGDQVSKQASAAVQQLTALRDQFVASVSPMIEKQLPKRARRQSLIQVPASAPSLSQAEIEKLKQEHQANANKPTGPQQHAELLGSSRLKRQIQYPSLNTGEQALPPQTGTNGQSSGGGGILKYLADLGQQAQQAQAITQFIQAAGGSGANQPKSSDSPLAALAQSATASTSSTGSGVAQVMGQIAELIRSTQDRNARVLESSQRSLEGANQQTMEAAKNAQGGVQSTLAEMTQSLQKLASNNPNLLPDIRSLYQTIASRLSSSSASASAQAAADSGNQLQDQLRRLPVAAQS